MNRQPESLSSALCAEPSLKRLNQDTQIAYIGPQSSSDCTHLHITDDEANRRTKLLIVETVSSVFWFLMDATWMFGLGPIAVTMAVLTIVSNLLVFRWADRTPSYFLITAAMTFWALMNVFWMLTDVKLWKGGLALAAVFFVLGAISLISAFIAAKNNREALSAVIHRFRRFRVESRDDSSDGSEN